MAHITQGLFSSATDEWATPQRLFDDLDAEFHFTLDACATDANAKCERYYTREDDGLVQDWSGEVVWCNPPYGKVIGQWMRKCSEEAKKPNTTIVALLPSRTDTRWFHDFIYNKVKEIRFIKGRLKFNDCKQSAPFPSMIVIWQE